MYKLYLSSPCRWYYKVCCDVVVSQILISGGSVACLDFVFSAEIIKRSLGDVNLAENIEERLCAIPKRYDT